MQVDDGEGVSSARAEKTREKTKKTKQEKKEKKEKTNQGRQSFMDQSVGSGRAYSCFETASSGISEFARSSSSSRMSIS